MCENCENPQKIRVVRSIEADCIRTEKGFEIEKIIKEETKYYCGVCLEELSKECLERIVEWLKEKNQDEVEKRLAAKEVKT